VAIGRGAALVLAFAGFATGLGGQDVPDDAVAVVEDVNDGTITRDEFDDAMRQVAASQGLKGGVPKEDDPQFDLFKEQALSDLILSRWIRGEAADRGVTVSDREVEQRLEQIKEQNFGSEKEFQRFLDQSGFSQEEALDRVRLTLLGERIQDELVTGAEAVAQEDIQTVYEQQTSQFQQDETRDVRVIVNKSEQKVEQAKAELEEDDSPKSWERVAKEFSTDEAEASLHMRLAEPGHDKDHMLAEFLMLLWHRFPAWLIGRRIPLSRIGFEFAWSAAWGRRLRPDLPVPSGRSPCPISFS
jgi:parvulin-like peptidyl-prolyl isomerase